MPNRYATYSERQAGLPFKDSVRVATTANITLSGLQTIDGVSLSAGDRVLVKDQSTGSQNGLYAVASGSWTRTEDLPTGSNASSILLLVEEGSVAADTIFICTSDDGSAVVGTDSLVFTEFSGSSGGGGADIYDAVVRSRAELVAVSGVTTGAGTITVPSSLRILVDGEISLNANERVIIADNAVLTGTDPDFTTGNRGAAIIGDNGGAAVVDFSTVDRISFRNIKVQNTSTTNNSIGILISGFAGNGSVDEFCNIENCVVSAIQGIQIVNSDYVQIRGCTFHGAETGTIHGGIVFDGAVSNDTLIQNCVFYHNGTGVYFDNSSTKTLIDGCLFNAAGATGGGTGTGVEFSTTSTEPTGTTILNCIFSSTISDSNNRAVISTTSTNLQDFRVQNCTFDIGTGTVDLSLGSVTNGIISGNRSVGSRFIAFVSGSNITDVIISDNNCSSSGVTGNLFRCQGTLTRCNVSNNIIDSGNRALFINGVVSSCIFSNNQGPRGTDLSLFYFDNGSGNHTNNTFIGNNSNGNNSILIIRGSSGVTFDNWILVGNNAADLVTNESFAVQPFTTGTFGANSVARANIDGGTVVADFG